MFVLMGNFHSRALSATAATTPAAGGNAEIDSLTMRDLFNSLAALIDQYPRIKVGLGIRWVAGPSNWVGLGFRWGLEMG